MLPRKATEHGEGSGKPKVNVTHFVEIAKATVYSQDFQAEVKAYMQKTGKAQLTSEEILSLYSEFLRK